MRMDMDACMYMWSLNEVRALKLRMDPWPSYWRPYMQ